MVTSAWLLVLVPQLVSAFSIGDRLPNVTGSRNVSFLIGTWSGVQLYSVGTPGPLATILNSAGAANVDYHLRLNRAYVYSIDQLYRSTLEPKVETGSDELIPVSVISSYCEGFAVDWVHDSIYWIDSSTNSLKVSDLDGRGSTTLFKLPGDRGSVSRMEVDPVAGRLFWEASGIVEWSDLAGGDYRTNLSLPGVDVWALALDIAASRLYYVGVANMSTYNLYELSYGQNSLLGTVKYPSQPDLENASGMGVVDGVLYWVNFNDYKGVIYRQPLNRTAQPEEIVQLIDWEVSHMRVVDPDLQKASSGDPCHSLSCQHVCVHQGGVARCLCPDGKRLLPSDNSTCIGLPNVTGSRNVSFLIGTRAGVRLYSVGTPGSFATITKRAGVYNADYHLRLNRAYVYSNYQLYRSTLEPKVETGSDKLIPVSVITSDRDVFAVDWVHDSIYWMDSSTNSLKVSDLDGRGSTTLVKLPRDRWLGRGMEVDPMAGRLFWVANEILEWSDLAGGDYRTNLSVPGVEVHVLALDIPTSRLYYVGGANWSTSLYELSYGQNTLLGTVKYPSLPNLWNVYGMGVVDGVLYWLNSADKGVIYRQPLNKTGQPEMVRRIGRWVWHMKVVDPDLQKPSSGDPCHSLSCQHVCVHQGGVARCLCPDGKRLLPSDNSTCDGEFGLRFLIGVNGAVMMYDPKSRKPELSTVMNVDGYISDLNYHFRKDLAFIYTNHTLFRYPLLSKFDTPSSLVRMPISSCDGFTVDWEADVIYILDYTNNSILSATLEGDNVTTFLRRPEKHAYIQNMEVDPYYRLLIWTADGVLESCDLSGRNFRTNLGDPEYYVIATTLHLATRTIYYISRGSMGLRLFRQRYDQRWASPHPPVALDQMCRVEGLGIFRDHIYWVNYNIRLVLYKAPLNVSTSDDVVAVKVLEKWPRSMRLVHPELQSRPFSLEPSTTIGPEERPICQTDDCKSSDLY